MTRWLPLLLLVGCAARGSRIGANELARELEAHPEQYVVVDVRSDREWSGPKGHIPGASHHAYPGVQKAADAIEASPEQTVVLVCFTGHRSQWSMPEVKAAHEGPVVDLKGGMMAWWRRDLPVEVEADPER